MNVFNAGQLARAFDLPYVTAERIIREAKAQHQRRWFPLTIAGCACALAGLVSALLQTSASSLATHLWFVSGVVLTLLALSLTRRAARQPIIDAARQASPRRD